MIPGAQKVDGADIGVSQCGGGGGLGTADDMNEKTVCCKNKTKNAFQVFCA